MSPFSAHSLVFSSTSTLFLGSLFSNVYSLLIYSSYSLTFCLSLYTPSPPSLKLSLSLSDIHCLSVFIQTLSSLHFSNVYSTLVWSHLESLLLTNPLPPTQNFKIIELYSSWNLYKKSPWFQTVLYIKKNRGIWGWNKQVMNSPYCV